MRRLYRVGISICLLIASAGQANAQYTTAPYTLQQYFDNAGAPLSAGGMCVFSAGTSTLAVTKTTATGAVNNANPILFDSAGRPASQGFFLSPGTSYKLVLKDFTGVVSPTCVPDTGVTIWSQDGIEAVPGSASAVDVTATVGESVLAGEVVYLSDGTASKTQGLWYKADADLVYTTMFPTIGMAVTDILSGNEGSVRIAGELTGLSGLTVGADYYVSTTLGGVTATAPMFTRLLGRSNSPTSLVITGNPRPPAILPTVPCGRLSLLTGVAVPTTEVTAAVSVFYVPYGGCDTVTIYTGVAWAPAKFPSQLTLAIPAVANQMYDAFVYDNAGTLTLELTAWTNDTTRATALTTQDNAFVKTGALTRLFLGSVRTTAVAGQSEDILADRLLWNYYRRVRTPVYAADTASASYTYTVATWRQSRATGTNQIRVVQGVAEEPLALNFLSYSYNDTGLGVSINQGIGVDSTTVPTRSGVNYAVSANEAKQVDVALTQIPAIGLHTYVMLEASQATGVTTFFGSNTAQTAGTLIGNSQMTGMWTR